MRSVPVIVDSHLRLDGNLIGHDLANEIFDELTINNHAKDVAKRMNRWGWEELPDDFLLGEPRWRHRRHATRLCAPVEDTVAAEAAPGPVG